MACETRWSRVGALFLALALSACKTQAPYVWADALPAPAEPVEKAYVIQPGDQLSIRVWGQETMSARTKVRPDGRISLPFLDDVDAAGSTPAAHPGPSEGVRGQPRGDGLAGGTSPDQCRRPWGGRPPRSVPVRSWGGRAAGPCCRGRDDTLRRQGRHLRHQEAHGKQSTGADPLHLPVADRSPGTGQGGDIVVVE
jgi:hypothetical protein